MRLDYLFIIPISMADRKESLKDAFDRLRMCELAFAGMDGVVVSDMELRSGVTDSALRTVRELTADGRRLLLLCGTDDVLDFDKQTNYRDLLSLCYPVYIRRENDRMLDNVIVGKLSKYYSETGKMFRKLMGDPVMISSSEIRERVRDGKDISHLVPLLVESHIQAEGLYKKI